MVTLRPASQLTLEVLADFEALSDLRERLRAWTGQLGVAAGPRDDLLLVATELCANAIEANAHDQPVEVTVSTDGTALRLAVANEHDGPFAEPPDLAVGSLQQRGRGLAVVRALVDTFVMTNVGGRTVVRTMQLL